MFPIFCAVFSTFLCVAKEKWQKKRNQRRFPLESSGVVSFAERFYIRTYLYPRRPSCRHFCYHYPLPRTSFRLLWCRIKADFYQTVIARRLRRGNPYHLARGVFASLRMTAEGKSGSASWLPCAKTRTVKKTCRWHVFRCKPSEDGCQRS